MATSGIGRGRGWLNLNKNNGNVTNTRPGIGHVTSVNSVMPSPTTIISTVDSQTTIVSPTSSIRSNCPLKYAKLVSLINQLNNVDDGILMNQKFKIINDTWATDCPTGSQVEESFTYIYQKCLEDEIFAMKVVAMVASNTFSKVEISEQKIRRLFIGHIQHTYENSKHLQTSSPNNFRIAVRILSEFYNKARLSTGKQISLLVSPLLCYLEMLLESSQPADIQLFTSQLHLNGASIKSEFPQQLADILCNVRKILAYNLQLTHTSKLFLLLAVDLTINRFGFLSQDILKFYQDELGDKIMADFQDQLGALSIQTAQTNKALDGYQSNVSVLQVTPPDSTSPVGESPSVSTKNVPTQHQQTLHQSNTSSTTQNIYTQSQSYNKTTSICNNDSTIDVGNWDTKKYKTIVPNREKTGRPILGAGARFQKDKQDGANWRDHHKENSSNWSKDKSDSGSDWQEKKTKNYNKGWEHDDRFENDYQ